MTAAMRSTQAGSSSGKEAFKRGFQSKTQSAHRSQHLGGHVNLEPSSPSGAGSHAAMSLAQSDLARQAFREALRLGKVRPRTLKLMFVGQGRAGKTSTLKALTGQGFNSQEESTHGLHAAMPLVQAAGAQGSTSLDVQSALVSQWQVLHRSEHEIHGAELERTCAQYVVERIRDTPAAAAGQSGDTNLSFFPGEADAEEADEVTSKMCVDLVARMIDNDGPEDEEHEKVMLKTWDFGGQREYYVMHHLFLTNRGIYLVVTRLDAWLSSAALDGPEDERLSAETGEDGGAFEPPLEALTFWLSSIHVNAPDALILIVGTHADSVASCRSEVEARLEEEIVQLMGRVPGVERQIVLNMDAGLCFFPIDNSSVGGTGSGLPELRAAIDREASASIAPGGPFAQELPLPWIRLREALEDAAEGTTGDEGDLPPFTATFVLSLDKVRQMAEEAGIAGGDEELVECLRVLHDFGSIVYFNEAGLCDNIVLSTQWLADAMAHILNCPRIVKGGVAAARRLRERGELEDELLSRSLWRHNKFQQHHEVLLQMLHRFDLVVPGAGGSSGSAGAVHIVPSLLPLSAPDITSPPLDPDEVWGSLFFDFHGLLCRLLPTLFPKLVAASSREENIDVVGSLGLYRDSFRLLWMGHELIMDLLPPCRPQVVRVHSPNGTGLALDLVQSLLRLVKVTLAQNSHLSFTAGVLCKHCHALARSHGERHHVIDVNELLADRLVPCRASARAVEVPDGCWAAEWRQREAAALQPPVLHEEHAMTPAPPTLPPEMLESSIGSSLQGASSPKSSDRPRSSSPAPTVSTELSLAQTGTVIRLLYASPLWRSNEAGGTELPRLDVQQEISMLFEVAGEARAVLDVGLATASNLAGALTAAPELAKSRRAGLVLHLSLHCGDSGQTLLLEDDNGGTHEFSLEDLQGLLAATGGAERLQLVFLHACCSDLAGSIFVRAGAPHVICCRGAVFDATARAFTKAFYRAFCGSGRSVAQAFEIARFEIRTAAQPGLRAEAEKYFLLPSGDGAHNSCFCEVPSSASLGGDFFSFRACHTLLPARVEDFCGRAKDLWLLMQHLGSSRRCVAVFGPPEIGKSALLSELARFAGAPGRRYAGRVIHFALSPEDAAEDVRGEPLDSSMASSESSQDCFPHGPVLCRLLRALTATAGRVAQVQAGSSVFEADPCTMPMGDGFEVRTSRGSLIQSLQKLEAGGQRTLLIMDNLDPLLEEPVACEELRRILTEVLLHTERLELLLGTRQASLQALGAHKVVGYALERLRQNDAARLFLWRVHRPLVVADLSEAAAAVEAGSCEASAAHSLPLIMNAQNRSLVLTQLANHPLLQLCGGLPGHLRATADQVLPGQGTLWDIHRRYAQPEE